MPRSLRLLLSVLLPCGAVSAVVGWNGEPSTPADPPAAPYVQANPRYYKGNLHTHSFWSDGDEFPEMVADWYRRHGYQFLALTDHNILAEGERWLDVGSASRELALKNYVARFGESWVERREQAGKRQVRLKPLAEFRSLLEGPERFLLIPGEEITHRFAKSPVHLNAFNLRDLIPPVSGDSVAETVRANQRAVAEQRKRTGWRVLASVNHPNFGWAVRAEDLAALEDLRFFEVFNGHPDVRNYGDADHASCERVWDIVLALRLGKYRLPLVYGLATDDAHAYHAFGAGKANPGRGWVMARARYLTAEGVVVALEEGDFYASTGVTLNHIRKQNGRLSLSIRGEAGVRYHTQFIATLRDAPLTSEPRLDGKGAPLEVTRSYSAEVGKVVAESDGLEPSYVMTGQELYVRAKVTSDRPHPNPFRKGDMEVAWTQPVTP